MMITERIIDRAVVVFLTCVAVWIYISGALCDVIEVDSAQYAAISMEMLQNKSYLAVTERGLDYLDKPPFLFWINTVSFSLFGYTNFAYKIPSLLFTFFGLFYTYRLGRTLYDRDTGMVAAIVAGTTIGYFWVNNDVKTDAIVTACFVYSLYHLIIFIDQNRLKHLVLGSIGIGIGMLTKGPLGLVFPLTAVVLHLILKRDLKKLWRVRWTLLPLIVAIILLPMCIGLYRQFDLHPEKVVNGETGVSGLRFFFWEQSFGRITGENRWDNNKSFFYLFGTFLYLAFPFSILLIRAYYSRFRDLFRKNYSGEYYLLGGSLLILTLLSLSSYKIPHYAIIVLPLAGIIIGSDLKKLARSDPPRWLGIHNWILTSVVFALATISIMIFRLKWFNLALAILLILCFIWFQRRRKMFHALYVTALLLGFVFNSQVIPSLQEYGEGRRFAALIREKGLENETIYFFNRESRALEFYLQRRISVVDWHELLDKHRAEEQAWFYMSLDGKEAYLESGLQIESELCLMQYDPNRISMGFLNPKTREENLDHRFLIKFKSE